jgi:hypothetical protein
VGSDKCQGPLTLKGSELTKQEVTIRVLWGVAIEAKLGPIGVSAEFNYGIEVIVAEGGAWQIGLIVQVIGKADICRDPSAVSAKHQRVFAAFERDRPDQLTRQTPKTGSSRMHSGSSLTLPSSGCGSIRQTTATAFRPGARFTRRRARFPMTPTSRCARAELG